MVDLTLPDVAPAQDAADASGRLVARVLAWQHRHPLARRLGAGDVTGLGMIALPYGAGDAGQGATPLFHQPSLLPGLTHRALVGFAARHAVGQRPGPAEWPQRDIERADASTEPAPQTRFLLTAAIADPRSALPRRVLLAPAGTAVWGRRPLDPLRTGVAGALAAALLVLAAWGLALGLGRGAAPPQATPSPAQAGSAVASPAPWQAAASGVPAVQGGQAVPASAVADKTLTAPRSASEPVPERVVPESVPVARPTPAATPARAIAARDLSASTPVSAGPLPGRGAAAPDMPASVAPPRLLPMPSRPAASAAASAPELPVPATAATAPAGPHFALVSVPSKKRADAEVTLQRVRQVLGPAIGTLQIQVMPSPQGFVVTLWPLPTEADAERLAEVLARRGVPMKWLEF